MENINDLAANSTKDMNELSDVNTAAYDNMNHYFTFLSMNYLLEYSSAARIDDFPPLLLT